MTEFAKGDCVRLKSGGPIMTVTRPSGMIHRSDAWVIWIDDEGQKHERHFPNDSLMRVGSGAGEAGVSLAS